MPALAFSLAMLAKLGPLLALEDDFCSPALALAVDHKDPNASPEDLDAAGFAPTEEVVVAEVKDEVDGIPGR